jgi:hypothetical protein
MQSRSIGKVVKNMQEGPSTQFRVDEPRNDFVRRRY